MNEHERRIKEFVEELLAHELVRTISNCDGTFYVRVDPLEHSTKTFGGLVVARSWVEGFGLGTDRWALGSE